MFVQKVDLEETRLTRMIAATTANNKKHKNVNKDPKLKLFLDSCIVAGRDCHT